MTFYNVAWFFKSFTVHLIKVWCCFITKSVLFRFLSKYCARQHNEKFNLEDCFNHLQYISDPVLRKNAPKVDEDDNETKSANENLVKSQDDIIFESLLAANEIEE